MQWNGVWQDVGLLVDLVDIDFTADAIERIAGDPNLPTERRPAVLTLGGMTQLMLAEFAETAGTT